MSSLAWLSRARPLAVAMSLVVAVAACEERLSSGLACPALCPQQPQALKDTTLFPIDFDTTIGGFPATGTETELLLASQPGTFDARAIVRFDTLQTQFSHKGVVGSDSDLVKIDSAFLKLRVVRADTLGPDVTIEVYDVELAGTGGTPDDTSRGALVPLFVPSRLIGSRTFAAESLKDSLAVPLDGAKLLAKMLPDSIQRVRLGVRAFGSSPVELSVFSQEGGFSPLLFIRPSITDTTVQDILISARSKTPDDLTTQASLADFQIIATTPPPIPANVLRVGGTPGLRGYLRFNIPTEILDSSSVVRATLELTQRPNAAAPNAADTQTVRPFEMAASGLVTDLRRALVLLSFGLDTVALTPSDSGKRSFEMIAAMRRWRFTTADRTPRTIALRATRENSSGWQVDFYSRTAPDAVKPRLRVTYIPQSKPGLP